MVFLDDLLFGMGWGVSKTFLRIEISKIPAEANFVPADGGGCLANESSTFICFPNRRSTARTNFFVLGQNLKLNVS